MSDFSILLRNELLILLHCFDYFLWFLLRNKCFHFIFARTTITNGTITAILFVIPGAKLLQLKVSLFTFHYIFVRLFGDRSSVFNLLLQPEPLLPSVVDYGLDGALFSETAGKAQQGADISQPSDILIRYLFLNVSDRNVLPF